MMPVGRAIRVIRRSAGVLHNVGLLLVDVPLVAEPVDVEGLFARFDEISHAASLRSWRAPGERPPQRNTIAVATTRARMPRITPVIEFARESLGVLMPMIPSTIAAPPGTQAK